MDSNVIKFVKQEINVKNLLDEAIKKLENISVSKNIKIVINGEDDIAFIGDYKWELEAISNIIKNGIEHLDNGGIIKIDYRKLSIYDDGENRLYDTSDTICFKNDYKADIICLPMTGYGLTMSAFEAALYAKEVGAKIALPIHMDNPMFPPCFIFIEEMCKKYEVEYEILENDETIEVE